MNWLTEDLKQEVKDHFEKKYQRSLSPKEIELIAINLVESTEVILKFKWRKKYEN